MPPPSRPSIVATNPDWQPNPEYDSHGLFEFFLKGNITVVERLLIGIENARIFFAEQRQSFQTQPSCQFREEECQ